MDDLDDRPPPPRRPRTKWWRWNLVTLAVALFVLVWVRELFKFDYPATFLLAGLTFVVWLIAPLAFEYELTIKKAERLSRRATNSLPTGRRIMPTERLHLPMGLMLIRLYAVIHMLISALAMAVSLWNFVGNLPALYGQLGSAQSMRFMIQSSLFTVAMWPLISICCGAALWVLTDIAITRRVELNWRMQQSITPSPSLDQ